MKKTLFIITFILTSFSYSYAQETGAPSSQLGPHHIGLSAGGTSGVGFSYRYWPGTFGFQVTTLPLFNSGGSFVSLGLTGLALIQENEKIDLYGYLGNHLIFDDFDSPLYNVGAGLGIRIPMFDILNINFQAGYGVYAIGNDATTFLDAGVGLYYQL